jgi:hypothetical protein
MKIYKQSSKTTKAKNQNMAHRTPKIRPLTLRTQKIRFLALRTSKTRPLTLCTPKIRPLTLCISKIRFHKVLIFGQFIFIISDIENISSVLLLVASLHVCVHLKVYDIYLYSIRNCLQIPCDTSYMYNG